VAPLRHTRVHHGVAAHAVHGDREVTRRNARIFVELPIFFWEGGARDSSTLEEGT
jgi:hypothetical protein